MPRSKQNSAKKRMRQSFDAAVRAALAASHHDLLRVLTHLPRQQDAQLLDWPFLKRIALIGFAYELHNDSDVVQARNAAFSALVIAELLRSFGARSEARTVFQVGLFSNIRLLAIVAMSLALQVLIHHSPILERLFGTESLSLGQCAAWLVLGSIPLLVIELEKILRQSQATRLQTSTGRVLP